MGASPGATDGVVVLRRKPEFAESRSTTRTWSILQQRSLWLRAESLALFAGILWLYAQQGRGWLLFVILFLIPDVSLIANVASRHLAAVVYNVAHSYVLGVGLAVVGLHTADDVWLALGLAWNAHISFDRLLGLPYPMNVPTVVASENSKAGSHE
jgi:hypothetical protein